MLARRCLLIGFLQLYACIVGAEPLQALFSLSSDGREELSKSSALFQAIVNAKLVDVLVLKEFPLGNSRAILDALKSESLDIAVLPASVFSESVGEYVTGSDIRGSRRRQESEVGAYELARLEKNGLVGLTFWNAQSRQIVSRQRINSLADLKGKKIVAFDQPSREILSGVGALPIQLRAGETHMALETGIAEAAEFTVGRDLTTLATRGEFKSALSNITGTREFVLVVRNRYWNSLTYRAQVELAKAARLAALSSDQVAQEATESGMRAISSQGLNLVELTAEDRMTLQRASLSAWTLNDRSIDFLTRAISVTAEELVPRAAPKIGRSQQRDVYFATVRAFENTQTIEYQFGNRRSDEGPTYGLASVSLQSGRSLDDDLEDVATIKSLERFASDNVFKSKVKAATSFGANSGVLVFIHGYNNSFPDALRRAAQFAVDVGFNGPVILFSWPSDGTTLLYSHDEDRVPATRSGFTQFMAVMENLSSRDKINILAHSMGTRVVLDYTETLKESGNVNTKGKYRSLTLVASDTPIEYLRLQKDFISQIAERTSVYFSDKDRALWLSNQLHQVARLGSISGNKLFREPESVALGGSGFDFVNSAQIDRAFLTFSARHGYAFQTSRCLADLNALLIRGMGAEKRSELSPEALATRGNGGERYWELNPP